MFFRVWGMGWGWNVSGGRNLPRRFLLHRFLLSLVHVCSVCVVIAEICLYTHMLCNVRK